MSSIRIICAKSLEKAGFLHAKYNKKVMPGTFAEHHLDTSNGSKN